VVYQVYPRSFQDSNGDGIGDLPGILSRLDYLQWLGVDALWISPIYPSPMADFGYDVSDYVNVHPMFGTLADLDALIAGAHARGLRLILDFVPNHTSSRHPWFLESRDSSQSPRRDWYYWRDPAPGGGPPNNWLSRFDGESAWTLDEGTGQYYLHSFLAEQPDLDWRNPAVRAAMLDVMRFWFDRGVDGFRVDVSYRVMKDAALRDNPPNPNWRAGMDPSKKVIELYSKNTPDIHAFNRWLRTVAEAYDQRVLIGEINLPLPALVRHYGDDDEFHLPFNFRLIDAEWRADIVRDLVERYEALLPEGAWPNYVLGNHDQHRVASRVGQAQARVAMMLLLTLRGTPTLYYGDELGMEDVPISAEQVQDPWEKFVPGQGFGRDPERTPMQWDARPNAGFCPADADPWLPLEADYGTRNVAAQREEPDSLLRLTYLLLALRRHHPALHGGAYRSLATPAGVFGYAREADGERFIVLLNFSDEARQLAIPSVLLPTAPLVSTLGEAQGPDNAGNLALRPNEGLLLH
jgi:alpha-glucosidase